MKKSDSRQLLHRTVGLCGTCRRALEAQVVEDQSGQVWMFKTCPEHGEQNVKLSPNAAWYKATRGTPSESSSGALDSSSNPPLEVEHGCPFDCGPCASHSQPIRMPVVTITSACDLNCPMCYVHNKNDNAFFMSREEFSLVVKRLVQNAGGDLDLINLTGGEPTLHPELLDFIEICHREGTHRVSVCSHGLGLNKNPEMLSGLARLGARIALSFDTFDSATDQRLNGVRSVEAKLRCLKALDAHGVDTTLIPVLARGYNEHEIGEIIRLGLRLSCVRHIEVHMLTFTGQNGNGFDRSARLSLYEALQAVEKTTKGLLRVSDFVSSPSAHPLCYQIAYLLMDPNKGGEPGIPFTRFLSRQTLYECLQDHLYLEPGSRLERALQDAITRVWAADSDEFPPETLPRLEALLRQSFPPGKPLPKSEALRVSERSVKAVYLHSHMDEETFDVERAMQCCDVNAYADGSTIPVCNSNVLYRDKDPRFKAQPLQWGPRRGLKRRLPLLRPTQLDSAP